MPCSASKRSRSVRAVTIAHPGGPEVLTVSEVPDPVAQPHELVIAVEAAGVSRADAMQREGRYPPPPGASPVPGLEVAGIVLTCGADVTGWSAGDRVCALVNGGGYATRAIAAAGQVLPIPPGWTAVEAATLPENYFTVWDNVFTRARLRSGETLLVHGGGSGIGTTAILLARAFGARVIATAGSPDKCAACVELGASAAIDYRSADFVAETLRLTAGRGADVILDIVGGDYVRRDVEALALDGRIACIATAAGSEAVIHLPRLMQKRGAILASSLRPRSDAEKAAIAQSLREHVWPKLEQRNPLRPVVDRVFPLERVQDAHRRLDSGAHFGKIVLTAGG